MIPQARWRDPLCVLFVSAVGSAAYVFGLGFYSDDWWLFLEPLAASSDQSWSGLYRALAETPFVAVRPGQILWYVAFHKLAPGNATLVHVANHAVFALSALLLYASLHAVPATRRAAYHVALLYACLPTFSAAKMWYANHQAVLGLLLFTLTWWLVTRLAREGKPWLVPLVALTAALGNLCYELFAVTALALPLFVWWGLGHRSRQFARDRTFLATTVAIAAGFVATTLFKLQFDYGVELPASVPEAGQFVAQAASMYARAAETTFWTLGLYSPRTAAGVLASPYLQPGSLVAPLLVLLVASGREWLAGRTAQVSADGEAGPAFFAVSGAAAFVLGYVPYLTNFMYSPKPWGEGNRGNIAAALGAALLIYALFRWASGKRPLLARFVLVIFCAIGVFLQVAIGKMWVRAADEQDRVIARFERIVPEELKGRGTLLLYGTCPYYGAGPVFAYRWDLQARLAVRHGYRNFEVALVRPQMTLGTDAITLPSGRWGTPAYRYGTLHIVDMVSGSVTAISGRRDAIRFFAAHPIEESFTCEFEFGIGNPLY